jgi:hypothetical protein
MITKLIKGALERHKPSPSLACPGHHYIPRGQVWIGDGAPDPPGKIPKKIWTYWDNVEIPPLVEACINSWYQRCPEYEITLVTPGNLTEFISETPNDFFSQTPQRQSDYIRLCLINEYGGIWMDATTICFKGLDYVRTSAEMNYSDFVAYYNKSHTNDCRFPIVESWFFASSKRSKFVANWKEEFYKSINMGEVEYIKYLSKSFEIKNLQQNLRTPYYFSIHIAAQKLLREPNNYRLSLLQAQNDAFRALGRLEWRIDEITNFFLLEKDGDVIEKILRNTNICKLTGTVWRPLQDAISRGEFENGSIIGSLMNERFFSQTDSVIQ